MGEGSVQVQVRDQTSVISANSGIFVETKQRFIDATKSLLDIANESADAFPPLKSCVGGINALIKYYEVRLRRTVHNPTDTPGPSQGYKDVEDKLEDLVIWLTKLKNSVTSGIDSGEEAKRREQLARFLSYPCHLVDSS